MVGPFFGPVSWNLLLFWLFFWTRFGPLANSRSGNPGFN